MGKCSQHLKWMKSADSSIPHSHASIVSRVSHGVESKEWLNSILCQAYMGRRNS